MTTNQRIEGYAYAKLEELVECLSCDIRPARERLAHCYHLVFIVSPSDFKDAQLQKKWASVQSALKDKLTNYGSERAPIESVTVRNSTLKRTLRTIWDVYTELRPDS